MTEDDLIERTRAFVRKELSGAEAGHDWFHIERVWRNARVIAQTEPVDPLVVDLAALLHDIADAKFHDGDEEAGPRKAQAFLESESVDPGVTDHVVNIIRHMSFRSGLEGTRFRSPEMNVVQDADRLDAIGAIGIARAFAFGGHKGRALYDPGIPPNLHMSKEDYQRSTAPTINHFHEKLLLIRDRMNTKTGKGMAEERHRFMEAFLEQFHREWGE